MSRHDILLHSDASPDGAETRFFIEAEIRAGLRRAFLLPAGKRDEDETFRLLLAALAQRHGENRRPTNSFSGYRS